MSTFYELCEASLFLHRVVGAWNMLPTVGVGADTKVAFKRSLIRHNYMHGMEGWRSCAGRGD